MISYNEEDKNQYLNYNSIPSQIELFGRVVKTINDSDRLNLINRYGQARYGSNKIAISTKINDTEIAEDEIKLTYLHEMVHFILNFTGYEEILNDSKINLEQFVELLSSAIYQYEKTRIY